MDSAVSNVSLITYGAGLSLVSAFLGSTLLSFAITALVLEVVYFIYWLYLTNINIPLETYVRARLVGLLVSFSVFILVKVLIWDFKRRQNQLH